MIEGVNDVIVGLGSNINPDENIKAALAIIQKEFLDIEISEFIETAPVGFKDQAHFMNGAVRFKTTRNAEALKNWLLNVEDTLGRVRTENKNGPRTIDLDILVVNGTILDDAVFTTDFLQKSIHALDPEIIATVKNKIS